MRNSNHVTWFRCLLPQLKTNSNFTLDMANKLYIKKEVRPEKKYFRKKSDYGCLYCTNLNVCFMTFFEVP